MQSSREEQGELRKQSEQCKKKGNNRMGKTRDISKKIRDTKGTLHEKMGTGKDKNGMDITKDIKKRWQEYTELHNKIFMTQIITMV